MTYLPPPKGQFDVEWATQNNRIIQQEISRLAPLATRVADLETGKQPLDGDLTAIAALTGTGYLKRTGSDAWSLNVTIPNTDISGLGTMSTQSATSVNIDGGTIDGTAIGATTPSTGAFTTLTTTGNASVGGSLNLTNPSQSAAFWFDGAVRRAAWFADTGLNQFSLARYDASGNFLERAMTVAYAAGGAVSITGTLSVSSTISASNLDGTTYTPTLFNASGLDAGASSAGTWQYMRVGNTVTVSGCPTIATTAANAQFEISLPIASNFTNIGDCAGTGIAVALSGTTGASVEAGITNDRAYVRYYNSGSGSGNVSFHFTYTIK